MLFNCKIIEVPGTITKAFSVDSNAGLQLGGGASTASSSLRALLLQVRPACKGCNAPLKEEMALHCE